MKTPYTLHTVPPCHAAITKALANAGSEKRVTLGLDLELATPAGALIIGGAAPLYLGKHPRSLWIELVRWLKAQGCEVHAVQEACGFGWKFHKDLQAAGADSRVVAPQELSGKRKTDKRDARALARLLWDYVVQGNHENLRIVRVPSSEEQQKRGYHRNRNQWTKLRCQLESQGRSLMWDHGWLEVPQGWWHPKTWQELKAQLEAAGHSWLVSMLEPIHKICRDMAARVRELKELALAQLESIRPVAPAEMTDSEQRAPLPEPLPVAVLPKGFGELSYVTLVTEVVDFSRFKNRGQAGSFIGCCPQEHSSGNKQKLGQIDRIGSARLRTTLVEAVWRLRKWNPLWRGFRKFAAALGPQAKATGAQKRKAVVACARLLMIDLWRLQMGTATLEGLGMVPADS